jgi:hypothetical protein
MHIIPIHVLEERVTLNLQCIIWTGSQSSSGIPSEQLQGHVSESSARQMARTFCKIDTASLGMVIGYSGSSSKMASKISSSSSPLNGDCPNNISYVSTPNAHQSTARPYRCSKRIYPNKVTRRFTIDWITDLGRHKFGSSAKGTGSLAVKHIFLA